MSLLRFPNAAGRGPTGALWSGIADWAKGINALDQGSGRVDDFTPYLGDDVGITIDGDAGAVQTDEPHGVVLYTEGTTGADECAGFLVNQYVDLDRTGFKLFCMEARLKSNDDNDTTQTFVGLSDVTIGSFFGTDNTPDGSSIGIRWNGDETLDLVSISSTDVITVLKDSFATVPRTDGFVKIGVKIENLDGTNYLVTATITNDEQDDAATVVATATTSTIPGEVMRPYVIHTNDNEADPAMEVDWYAVYDKG